MVAYRLRTPHRNIHNTETQTLDDGQILRRQTPTTVQRRDGRELGFRHLHGMLRTVLEYFAKTRGLETPPSFLLVYQGTYESDLHHQDPVIEVALSARQYD